MPRRDISVATCRGIKPLLHPAANQPTILVNKTTLKSIWAVLAGVLTVIIVTTAVDIVLHVLHFFPPMDQPINDAQALLASSYRLPISIAATYLTACLAPDRPMRHAWILGFIGIALGLVGLVATWNLGLGPHWYPISLVVLAVPQCWVGGKLYELRSRQRAA